MPKQTKTRISFWPLCIMGAMVGTVISQTLLDLFSILMVFGIGYDFWKNREDCLSRFKQLKIEWAFLGYFFIVVLGFFINAAADAEIGRSLSKFTWVPTLYVYLYAFSRVRFDVKGVLAFLAYGFLFSNIYTVVSYLIHFDFLTGDTIFRARGLVNSATYHAHTNAILFVFFAAIMLFYFSKLSRFWKSCSGIALGLFFAGIFLTFVRGIWISIFVSTFVMFFLINFKFSVKLLLTSILGFGILFAALPGFREQLTRVESNQERANLFKLNLQIFNEYPLLGIGHGENLRRNREYWDRPEWNMPVDYITSHAHNQYVNVLAATGIFGFAFFMSFMLFFLRKNWQMLKKETDKTSFKYVLIFACLWAQIEFFLACLTDVTFEYAKIRALYLFVWALVIAVDRYSDAMIEETQNA